MKNTNIDWLTVAIEGHCVSIGQIPDDQKKRLESAVRRETIKKFRLPWCYVHPYGFSTAIKTFYCAPRYTEKLLRAEIKRLGMEQAASLAKKGIVPSESELQNIRTQKLFR